jgi:hypothetical protein
MEFKNACGNPACANRGTKICSRCRNKYYCSVECQSKHWDEHKPKCIPLPLDQDLKQLEATRSEVSGVLLRPAVILALNLEYLRHMKEGGDFIFVFFAKDLLQYGETRKAPVFRKLLKKDLKMEDKWHEFMKREPHGSGKFIFIEVVEDEKNGLVSKRSMRMMLG